MIKQVEASEFDTNNRLVASTKLQEEDKVISILPVKEIGQNTVCIWTNDEYALRFALDDVPVQKKNARGVRGIKLHKDDFCIGCEVVTPESAVKFGKREVKLSNLKTAVRGGSGTKQKNS